VRMVSGTQRVDKQAKRWHRLTAAGVVAKSLRDNGVSGRFAAKTPMAAADEALPERVHMTAGQNPGQFSGHRITATARVPVGSARPMNGGAY